MSENFNGILLFILLILGGCASLISTKNSKETNKPNPGFLFKEGVYHQSIVLTIMNIEKSENQEFQFNAILKKEANQIVLVGYNALGMNLFRIEENSPKQIEWTSEIELLNKNKKSMLEIFPKIKYLFSIKGSDLVATDGYYIYNESEKVDTFMKKIKFYEFNEQGFPVKFEITDENYFAVQIRNQ